MTAYPPLTPQERIVLLAEDNALMVRIIHRFSPLVAANMAEMDRLRAEAEERARVRADRREVSRLAGGAVVVQAEDDDQCS